MAWLDSRALRDGLDVLFLHTIHGYSIGMKADRQRREVITMGCCGGGRQMWYGSNDSRPRPQDSSARSAAQDTPLELLKQRLARGEITLDEYEKLAKVLSS